MMRILFACYRVGAWLRGLASRRLTRAGGFVLVGLALAASLTANPEQTTLAYQPFVLLTVLLLVSLGFAPFFQVRLEVERRLPRFGTAGEPLRYRVIVRNPTSRPQAGLEYLEHFQGTRLTFEEFNDRLRPGRRSRTFQLSTPMPSADLVRWEAQALPALPGSGRAELGAEVLPLRRGALRFSALWLARPDPLGLVRGLQRVHAPATVMILPRRYPLRAAALPGNTQYQHGGVAFASGVGQSEEFIGVREYRRGDALRRVYWKATARLGRPVVREYQDEFFVRHALVLDTFADASVDGLFEEAVSVASSFACTVPDQDALLDLLFMGPRIVCVTAGRGVGHAEQMLETLACARPCRDPGRFADLQDLVLQHSARLSGCVLVLLQWDEARRGLVRRLKALQIPVWALILTAPGEPPPDRGPAADQPDRWVVLESGRVAEGLRGL